jgi:hypothetical protein
LLAAILLLASVCVRAQSAPTTRSPLNSSGVATGCNNTSIQCTYTDLNVPVGKHFYFVVAQNSNGYSTVSNSVNLTISLSGSYVVVSWTPSVTTSPTVTYFIYRGAPPTNLGVLQVR